MALLGRKVRLVLRVRPEQQGRPAHKDQRGPMERMGLMATTALPDHRGRRVSKAFRVSKAIPVPQAQRARQVRKVHRVIREQQAHRVRRVLLAQQARKVRRASKVSKGIPELRVPLALLVRRDRRAIPALTAQRVPRVRRGRKVIRALPEQLERQGQLAQPELRADAISTHYHPSVRV